MKIKTSELTGAALDWAVAKCEGREMRAWRTYKRLNQTNYSTDWSQGGPIIEREGIDLEFRPMGSSQDWYAVDTSRDHWGSGPTPLIAAMRCYVASKLGDTIDIPEELK